MMNAKMKLQLARQAMYFLEQAIRAMEQPNTGPADPDYDLWRAFTNLQKIDDAAGVEQEPEGQDDSYDSEARK